MIFFFLDPSRLMAYCFALCQNLQGIQNEVKTILYQARKREERYVDRVKDLERRVAEGEYENRHLRASISARRVNTASWGGGGLRISTLR